MRLRCRRSDPGGIHRGVEFYPPQPRVLHPTDRSDRLGRAGHDLRSLRRQRVLLVDDVGDERFAHQQVAGLAPLGRIDRAIDVGAGAAEAGDPGREVGEHVPVVADVEMAVPQAGDERLAGAIDGARACRRGNRARGANLHDLPVRGEHGLVGEEAAVVGVEQAHIVEQHRRFGLIVAEAVGNRAHHLRGFGVLEVEHRPDVAFVSGGQRRDEARFAEIFAVGIEPEGDRRGREPADPGQLDRLRAVGAFDLERAAFLERRPSAWVEPDALGAVVPMLLLPAALGDEPPVA